MVARVVLCFFVLFTFARCAGERAFTEGKYDDPTKVRLLDDKFNEADLQQIAETMINSMLSAEPIKTGKGGKRPIVQVESVKNSTEEHIDTKSLTDKIRVHLTKSNKVRFSNKEERGTLAKEYEYAEEGNIKQGTEKRRGGQIGADYILSGEITSNVQQVGDKKLIYYKMTLNLTDIETNIIEWSDEQELRKAFKKRSVGI
jgi:uncharacterized protein (TIGR02722 family)